MRAMSSFRSWTSSRTRNRIADFFDSEVARQPGKAAFAAWTPLSISSADAKSTAPKHAFLRYLVETRDVLFHGTGRSDVAEFEPQRQTDYDGTWTEAVFASDDPIWPMFFATVNRELARSLINGCSRRLGESRYYFSISADPRAPESWRTGWIYILPRETFRRHPAGSEWLSPVAVRPLARLRIEPTDFPFLGDVVRHSRTEPVPKAVLRATVGRAWGR